MRKSIVRKKLESLLAPDGVVSPRATELAAMMERTVYQFWLLEAAAERETLPKMFAQRDANARLRRRF